jgi:hypothetical protein
MSLTDVKICSSALVVHLGSKPIGSLSEETDRAIVCSNAFLPLMEFLICSYPWRFATKRAKLTRTTTTDTNGFSYEFLMPSDRLMQASYAVFDSGDVDAGPITEFSIYGGKLYANAQEIWVDYRFYPPENEWPAYFAKLAEVALASEIAFTITDQSTRASDLNIKAYGTPSEGMIGGLMGVARSADSEGTPTQSFEDYSLIDARFS